MQAGLLAIVIAAACSTGEIAFMRDGTVHLIDVDTAQQRSLIDVTYNRPLTWSPDGAHLIAWKHSEIGWDLWRIQPDASDEGAIEAINLTNTRSGGCRSPSYSPDGKRIAFMRDNPAGVWMMNADGSEMHQLTEQGYRDATPQWSPDGSKLLYLGPAAHEGYNRPRIRLVDLETGEDQPFTLYAPRWLGDVPQWVTTERIVFISRRDEGSAIIVSDLDGGNEQRVSVRTGNAYALSISPDRKSVAYLARPGDGTSELHVASLNQDGEPRELLSAVQGRLTAPAWSSDGRKLAVSSFDGDPPIIWIIDITSGAVCELTEGTWPTWRPQIETANTDP